MSRKETSLRKHILRLSLAGTMIMLILQTILFTYYSCKVFNEQSRTQNENALENMQGEIYNYIKGMETNLIGTYKEKSLIRDLENGLGIDMLQEKYYEEANLLQNENYDNSDSVVALYLYNKKDELISSYQKSMTEKYNYPRDIYNADYDVNRNEVSNYVKSKKTTMLVSSYYNQNREDEIIRFVLKLFKNSDTSKVIGYVVCDVDSDNLTDIMKKYLTTDDMMIWLQPEGDRAAASIGALQSMRQSDFRILVRRIQHHDASVEDTNSWAGFTLYEKQQTKYNFTAYMMQPQTVISQNLQTMLRVLIISVVIMGILTAIISSRISANISQPLEKLASIASRIKNGEAHLRVGNLERSDEIGVLGQNFDAMLDEIHGLMAEQYKTQMLLDRAEYLTLQAQINPHFLYNTLNTMGSIANLHHCETVSYLSQSLANIFRYTLNMSNPLATVSEEIAHVRNYVYVMDVRNRSSIQYEFNIAKDTFSDMLPRVSIEPLVENALSHGLKNARRKDKKVIIRAEHVNGNLVVSVEDNGVGTDPCEVTKKLNDEKYQWGENGHSIGLANINKRLKKLFGNEYGITFESEIGVGTKVTIQVTVLNVEEAQKWLNEHTAY